MSQVFVFGDSTLGARDPEGRMGASAAESPASAAETISVPCL